MVLVMNKKSRKQINYLLVVCLFPPRKTPLPGEKRIIYAKRMRALDGGHEDKNKPFQRRTDVTRIKFHK